MEQLGLEELREYAARFASKLAPRERAATVVTLSGDLGAGKTTFAQAFAKALGIEERVTSPTFIIENIYPLKGQRFERLVHIDAYRLESPHELEVLGFRELLRDPGTLVLIEWPEKARELIPKDAMNLRFDIAENGRIITVDGEEKD